MFNKISLLLVTVIAMFSSAIYASGDTDVLPMKEYIKDSSLCLVAAKEAGKEYGVDYDLLQAVSAVESGKWDELHNAYVAWPWTINVKGRGYYFKTRDEALAAVRKFQAKGIKSIDVGCMQINLKFHGKEFSSLEEAIDPTNNVKYGAKFLRTLYARNHHNWEQAAKKYHSANKNEGEKYAKRLQRRFHSYKVAGLSRTSDLF
ncbi:MAG: transglycosylase SLT domain-containing protein [Alphaproteobacteria bacterium]|nr:transglycosylase SLT domain-containing protein [Alphaproteobacteria bacterium]